MEKSHKQKMKIAFRKSRNLTEENKKKDIQINQLEENLKVYIFICEHILISYSSGDE